MEWISGVFESSEFGIAVLPAALLLGLLTAVSSGCNVGLLAAVAGYAGSRDETFRGRDAVLTSVCFFIGAIMSLALLGMLAGYIGQISGSGLGRIGIILTAFLAIFFGLTALNVVPFKIPSIDLSGKKRQAGFLGAAIFGIGIGAASLSCTLVCSGPLLPLALGMATARGQIGWGGIILTLFAVGYSLPLAAIMLGIGFGRLASFVNRAIKPIKAAAAVALIAAGIWMLYTV